VPEVSDVGRRTLLRHGIRVLDWREIEMAKGGSNPIKKAQEAFQNALKSMSKGKGKGKGKK
jgi:hypothetical protein